MFVALRCCRFSCNGCDPWWNNDQRYWGMLGDSVVDNLAIVCPICCHRRNVSTDLIKEVRHVGDVADIVRRQFHSNDFMRIGIDTEVHERGQSLSSGERQLIALARAFIARPRVLVLDEATSNLDLLSETKIEAALDVLLQGRTAILIAQEPGRLNSLATGRATAPKTPPGAPIEACWLCEPVAGAVGDTSGF